MKGIQYSPILAEANRANFDTNTTQIKTETRRTSGLKKVNESPDRYAFTTMVTDEVKGEYLAHFYDTHANESFYIKSPYGKPLDLFYVREEHYAYGHWEPTSKTTKGGNQKWAFKKTGPVRFNDNPPPQFETGIIRRSVSNWYRRTALFMPASYAKQFNIITEITIERLTDITEESAIREGIQPMDFEPIWGGKCYRDYSISDADLLDKYGNPKLDFPVMALARDSFFTLIQKIHTPQILNDNPWVWVIKYLPLSITGKPTQQQIAEVKKLLRQKPNYQFHKVGTALLQYSNSPITQ